MLICFVWFLTPDARGQPSKEYDLKAVFLFNFAQFVDWPAKAFESSQTPLTIGVLGQDPFGKVLDDVIRNERVKNRGLSVARFEKVEDIRDCHILFISASENARLEQILTALKGRSILTVGEADGFVQRGGAVGFVMEKTKLRLKINSDSTKAAGLTVSSKLLRVAEPVGVR